ncbi:GNAT family N-acetyltransferase [Flavobacterium sp. K5-23]|uniref:GNAT family N-acetyltransferase n=1 Tax=Flavobacterium sp. K5-23 TaxID=2746225 RepID=UPI00200CFAC2|nr:GNAT family N-acetyltransferase [Flavobacterium sp. K5-23]UQD56578.1 GNAT family N-acetyltransferase [Flavobacterium sp. K5-23]
MNIIEIKKASLSDLDLLRTISINTFIETFSDVNSVENMDNYVRDNFNTEQLTSELLNPDSHFYLATIENETLGYLKLNFGKAQTEIINEQAMEIHRIYVLQEFHGKKLGPLFMEQALLIANQKNVDYIWLGVWEENHRALNFYKKNGFVEFDSHVFTLGDDQQTDLLMKLQIKKQ